MDEPAYGEDELMGCNCGAGSRKYQYEVTLRHSGEKLVVASMVEVRQAIARAPKGGTHRVIAAK
jgi:hypothetical protein